MRPKNTIRKKYDVNLKTTKKKNPISCRIKDMNNAYIHLIEYFLCGKM